MKRSDAAASRAHLPRSAVIPIGMPFEQWIAAGLPCLTAERPEEIRDGGAVRAQRVHPRGARGK